MGKYFVDITDEAKEEIRRWHKVGDKALLKKIKRILLELSEHPTTGTGKAEPLRGDLAGYWSMEYGTLLCSSTCRVRR